MKDQIIDFQKGVYVGEHSNNQTLQGYVSALQECMERFAKKQIIEKWVCTSTFGFGEGYNERRDVLCLDFGSNVLTWVNRAFLKDGENLRPFMQLANKFDHIPVGGKFLIEDFVNHLKTKLN